MSTETDKPIEKRSIHELRRDAAFATAEHGKEAAEFLAATMHDIQFPIGVRVKCAIALHEKAVPSEQAIAMTAEVSTVKRVVLVDNARS